MTIEQRITALEKEVADLKRQLEGQPKRHPLGDSQKGNYDLRQPVCNVGCEKN